MINIFNQSMWIYYTMHFSSNYRILLKQLNISSNSGPQITIKPCFIPHPRYRPCASQSRGISGQVFQPPSTVPTEVIYSYHIYTTRWSQTKVIKVTSHFLNLVMLSLLLEHDLYKVTDVVHFRADKRHNIKLKYVHYSPLKLSHEQSQT